MVFSRKKTNSNAQLVFDGLNQQLDQLTNENSELRLELEDMRDSALRNKSLLDDFLEQTSKSDQVIQDLREKLKDLVYKSEENEIRIKELRTEKFQLATEKDSFRDAQPNGQNNIQEILDAVEKNEESLFFKDTRGCL